MKKLKRFIHRIKRHKRNKKLSKFADSLYFARYYSENNSVLLVHPLVYLLIRLRYPVSYKWLRLKDDSFLIKDYFDVIEVNYV